LPIATPTAFIDSHVSTIIPRSSRERAPLARTSTMRIHASITMVVAAHNQRAAMNDSHPISGQSATNACGG
jgi:hypothetical protein